MNRHFNTHLEGLDLQFWHDLIESRGKLMTLKKGEYLCRKGEPTNIYGYVKSGYLIYQKVENDDLISIGGFAFKDALFGDYPNCMYNNPALFNILTGRKTELWVMDATILPELYSENFKVCQQGRIFMELAYSSLLHRFYDMHSSTPIQRYLNLIHQHPQIEQDVSQKEIAEYLQIQPNSLSRIKRKLLLGK